MGVADWCVLIAPGAVLSADWLPGGAFRVQLSLRSTPAARCGSAPTATFLSGRQVHQTQTRSTMTTEVSKHAPDQEEANTEVILCSFSLHFGNLCEAVSHPVSPLLVVPSGGGEEGRGDWLRVPRHLLAFPCCGRTLNTVWRLFH